MVTSGLATGLEKTLFGVSYIKGTSNCLAEFQNLLKLTQIFQNFLYDIRNISPEINITLP